MAFRPYVPDYALRLLAGRGEEPPPFARRVDTAVLFADIAGFTPMSASLAAAGPYGAEELSDLLNAVFDRVTGLVGSYGGTVAKFAGDAVTAVFPARPGAQATAARRAVQCALDLQAAMTEFRAVATTAGAFALAMRAGVGAGGALLAVVGDPAVQLEHLVAGEAVDRAAAASRVAGRGEVAVDPALAAASDLGVELGERRGGGAAVVARLARRPRRPSPPAAAALPDDEFLAAFLHPAIAERVRRGQGGLVNEHRTVTVAFVGFPNLLSGGPERPPATRRRATAGRPVRVPPALERLQEYVAAAGVAVRRWGGHLRQVDLGDKGGVLVLAFGAPLRHEDHEERAVRCCLELLELPGGPFRAGVTTGVVWCGEVGSDARREYAVVGDSVNLAARLMEEAESGQLLLDHPTWERASGAAVGHRLRPVTVRGRSGTVTVWAVEEVRDRADPPGRSDAPGLVGRRAELAASQAAVRRLAAGDGGVLGLGGEPGIGKSRLANEAVALAGDLGVETLAGACRSLGTAASYLVWRPIWQGLLGLDPSRPISEQQVVLGERLGQRAPLLAPVVNLPLPDTELTALLDPSIRAELLRSLLLDLLRERAAAAPLLLVLEDLHWIDTPSRRLLAFLARNLTDLPVLLLLTARPVDGGPDPFEPVARLPHFTGVTLEELPPAEAAELASQRMGQLYGAGREPPAGALDRVVARAGGNPFYLEELVSLIHSRSGERAGDDLPDSVQRVVMARIDQLAEPEKAVVKVASVLGRRFRAGWIAGSYPAIGPAEEVTGHLERLEALGLTASQEAGPEPEYAFRHAITQEVAYESLTLRTREALHEGVSAYIEEAYADRLPQFVERLAYHYGRTRRTDKQRVWFRAAADAARAAFANEAAVDYYQRLLDLVPEPEAGPVLLDLGSVWHLVGRWAEAEETYRRAMSIAEAAGDRSLLAASHRELGNLFMYTQSYAEAIDWLTLASEEFQLLDDPAGLARTLDRLAYALIQQGSYKDAAEVAQRHLVIAEDAGDPAAVSAALDHIGLVCAYTGDQAGALEYLGRSLEMAGAAGDRRGVIDAANNLGGFYATSGDHVNALACFQRALASAQEIGYRQPAAVVVGNIGELYYLRGEYGRATRCFAHALRIAVELGDSTSVANRVASLAATAAAQGDAATAERRYARAIELARELEAPHFLCQWLYDLAELLAAAGRRREAEPLDTEAQAVAARHSERGTELRARLLATRLRVEEGRLAPEEAALELLPQQRAWTRPSPERAAILAEMARLGPAWDRERAAAAALYLDLYQRAPNVQYRHAYQQLTGTELPPGPPLPPPPAGVGPGGDVEELLAQVEQLTGTRPLAAAS
ncbi:MAG TPA: tetratricopeptide repeat protein [Actinomycetota bacterium]|nr:tetratricopeptide repeat protein [Actinomycetota bacterium]